jgi:putative NIF3 family GTP cyclohydrolase 1 type 2
VKLLYEIHLTVDTAHAERATWVANAFHWKTSEIARDPVLGNKNYFYLTKYSVTLESALSEIQEATAALKLHGVPLIREKVEHIVHDVRYVT